MQVLASCGAAQAAVADRRHTVCHPAAVDGLPDEVDGGQVAGPAVRALPGQALAQPQHVRLLHPPLLGRLVGLPDGLPVLPVAVAVGIVAVRVDLLELVAGVEGHQAAGGLDHGRAVAAPHAGDQGLVGVPLEQVGQPVELGLLVEPGAALLLVALLRLQVAVGPAVAVAVGAGPAPPRGDGHTQVLGDRGRLGWPAAPSCRPSGDAVDPAASTAPLGSAFGALVLLAGRHPRAHVQRADAPRRPRREACGTSRRPPRSRKPSPAELGAAGTRQSMTRAAGYPGPRHRPSSRLRPVVLVHLHCPYLVAGRDEVAALRNVDSEGERGVVLWRSRTTARRSCSPPRTHASSRPSCSCSPARWTRDGRAPHGLAFRRGTARSPVPF